MGDLYHLIETQLGSMVEHATVVRRVTGSIPVVGTFFKKQKFKKRFIKQQLIFKRTTMNGNNQILIIYCPCGFITASGNKPICNHWG